MATTKNAVFCVVIPCGIRDELSELERRIILRYVPKQKNFHYCR
jgi:hypothetical protein